MAIKQNLNSSNHQMSNVIIEFHTSSIVSLSCSMLGTFRSLYVYDILYNIISGVITDTTGGYFIPWCTMGACSCCSFLLAMVGLCFHGEGPRLRLRGRPDVLDKACAETLSIDKTIKVRNTSGGPLSE